MARRPAFTLLEVLIAISLFSLGMISALQVIPANRRYLTQSAQTTQAAYLAQEEVETLRDVPYSGLTVGTYEPLERLGATSADPLYQYQRTTAISLVDGSWNPSASDLGLKKIAVTVSWTEHGVSRTYGLSTYVHD